MYERQRRAQVLRCRPEKGRRAHLLVDTDRTRLFHHGSADCENWLCENRPANAFGLTPVQYVLGRCARLIGALKPEPTALVPVPHYRTLLDEDIVDAFMVKWRRLWTAIRNVVLADVLGVGDINRA